MTEKEERDGQTPQVAAENTARLSTSRRRIMQAMALTTVGTAAASVALPAASAQTPPLPQPGQKATVGRSNKAAGQRPPFPPWLARRIRVSRA